MRFVSTYDEEVAVTDKKILILRQIELINLPKNSRPYDQDDLCQAFSWYTRSRALYKDLRNCIQLPPEATLKKITRVSKNLSDVSLYKIFFMRRRSVKETVF